MPASVANCRVAFLLATVVLMSWQSTAAQQYTPEHPRVKEMVRKGVAYLQNGNARALAGEYATGGPILVGYAMFKVTGDPEHQLVKSALATSERLVDRLGVPNPPGEKIVYEASMAAILMASVDPGKYRPQLAQILYFFETIQKDHGGFGYLNRPTGDTSQVQYVMLALWTMHQVGVDIPTDVVEDTVMYLKRTMDPSGGWGYQGKVSNGALVRQDKVTKSLATAGIGAMIIGSDILGFYGSRRQLEKNESDIPEAFVRIDLREKIRRERRQSTLSRADTDGPLQAAVRYQNTTNFSGGLWYFYWRYSQERYESFVEIVNNQQNKSPPWYNEGVEELAELQADDGGWGTKGIISHTPPHVSTAFAVLFLIRSTQKSIGKLDEGFSFGGYGLPNNLSSIRMMGNRIVSDEETTVENFLAILEEDQIGDVQIGLLPEHLRLAKDPAARKEQITRLSRLLLSDDFRARRIAAKLLGRTDDLGVVPDLVYALTDPDPEVPFIAEESLRLLSRKLNAGKLTKGASASDKESASSFWKKWYLGLRPDYVFIAR